MKTAQTKSPEVLPVVVLKRKLAFWGFCVQENQRTWMGSFSPWLRWEHTCYSAGNTGTSSTTRETHPDILARNPNTFWSQSGCEKRLEELDLSNWLCGKTVLSSLRIVNSLEAGALSSNMLGCGWQRKHVVRVFLGTIRVWNLLSPGIISKRCHGSLISWYTDLNWKFTGVSSEKGNTLSATGKHEDVKIDLSHPPFPSPLPSTFLLNMHTL